MAPIRFGPKRGTGHLRGGARPCCSFPVLREGGLSRSELDRESGTVLELIVRARHVGCPSHHERHALSDIPAEIVERLFAEPQPHCIFERQLLAFAPATLPKLRRMPSVAVPFAPPFAHIYPRSISVRFHYRSASGEGNCGKLRPAGVGYGYEARPGQASSRGTGNKRSGTASFGRASGDRRFQA